MIRLIKIIFNALLLSLAFIGFNAIGGEKYVEAVRTNINNFIQEQVHTNVNEIGDFSNLNEEYKIDKTISLFGYKGLLAEHKASGQKMCIIDSGKKPLLTADDIIQDNLEKKLKKLSKKLKVQQVSIQEIQITKHGELYVYNQEVPYAKFEAKVSNLPFSEVSGIIASVKTTDNKEKLIVSINSMNKYSELITEDFFKEVNEENTKPSYIQGKL